jgi:hypothetical protein
MKVGDIVTINNISVSGKPIVEGKAKLIKKRLNYPNPYGKELWAVEFLAEPGEQFERFVEAYPIVSK